MVNNIKEAYAHVNNSYIFEPKHYPAIKDLNTDQRLVFALKHILLHMYKNIPPIAYVHSFNETCKLGEGYLFDKTREPETSVGLKFRNAVVKMLVNYLKLGEILGLSNEEFSDIIPLPMRELTKSFYGTTSDMMAALAVECEKADHTGSLSYEARQYLIRTLETSWATILHLFAKENIPVPYEWIPGYKQNEA